MPLRLPNYNIGGYFIHAIADHHSVVRQRDFQEQVSQHYCRRLGKVKIYKPIGTRIARSASKYGLNDGMDSPRFLLP